MEEGFDDWFKFEKQRWKRLRQDSKARVEARNEKEGGEDVDMTTTGAPMTKGAMDTFVQRNVEVAKQQFHILQLHQLHHRPGHFIIWCM